MDEPYSLDEYWSRVIARAVAIQAAEIMAQFMFTTDPEDVPDVGVQADIFETDMLNALADYGFDVRTDLSDYE